MTSTQTFVHWSLVNNGPRTLRMAYCVSVHSVCIPVTARAMICTLAWIGTLNYGVKYLKKQNMIDPSKCLGHSWLAWFQALVHPYYVPYVCLITPCLVSKLVDLNTLYQKSTFA